MKDLIVVTGSQGYIGRILCKELKARGYDVLGVFRRDYGIRDLDETLKYCSDWYRGSYADPNFFRWLSFDGIKDRLKGIIHLGADSLLAPSLTDPLRYYRNNVGNSSDFIEFLIKEKIDVPFIFASSAAVYGDLPIQPVNENDPCQPINPYGETKLTFEKILRNVYDAHGFKSTSFRFFNVVGGSYMFDDGYPAIGQRIDQPHIFPSMYRAAVNKETFVMNDPKVQRDYIHVEDVVGAIIHELRYGIQTCEAYNLSTGVGTSTEEIVEIFSNTLEWDGLSLNVERGDRRSGDPSVLVGSPTKFQRYSGLKSMFSELHLIAATSYDAFKHQQG